MADVEPPCGAHSPAESGPNEQYEILREEMTEKTGMMTLEVIMMQKFKQWSDTWNDGSWREKAANGRGSGQMMTNANQMQSAIHIIKQGAGCAIPQQYTHGQNSRKHGQ